MTALPNQASELGFPIDAVDWGVRKVRASLGRVQDNVLSR
jgi:hypothetical protein